MLTGGLAIIFLFPLLWSAVASVSAQPGTAQATGFGFGNYRRCSTTAPACRSYLANSVVRLACSPSR